MYDENSQWLRPYSRQSLQRCCWLRLRHRHLLSIVIEGATDGGWHGESWNGGTGAAFGLGLGLGFLGGALATAPYYTAPYYGTPGYGYAPSPAVPTTWYWCDAYQQYYPYLITHYPQLSRRGTKQEHTVVSAGLSDGAQQGAISKGAQRGPVCCSLRNRGSVPGGGDALALAIRLCLPSLRRGTS